MFTNMRCSEWTKNTVIITRDIGGEWLLFNANSAIFQLYHGENKLIFNEMMIRFVLDQHAELIGFL